MLRSSIVHWSHAGSELVKKHEALVSREVESINQSIGYLHYALP